MNTHLVHTTSMVVRIYCGYHSQHEILWLIIKIQISVAVLFCFTHFLGILWTELWGHLLYPWGESLESAENWLLTLNSMEVSASWHQVLWHLFLSNLALSWAQIFRGKITEVVEKKYVTSVFSSNQSPNCDSDSLTFGENIIHSSVV